MKFIINKTGKTVALVTALPIFLFLIVSYVSALDVAGTNGRVLQEDGTYLITPGYDSVVGVNIKLPNSPITNLSYATVNQSDWWDNLDTPSNILVDSWFSWATQTLTYNETKLNTTIHDWGFNETDSLTTFYDLRYLSGQLGLYFSNKTSSINSSYTIMNTTVPSSGTETNSFTALTAGDNLLTKRIFTELNLTNLEAGAYDQHTTIDYVSGTKDVSMRSELHILYSNGTETMIGTSPPSIGLIVGTYQQVEWTGTITNDVLFNVSGGDYLTMYLYATVSGVGQAPDIDLIVGEGTGARLDIGVNPTDVRVDEVDPVWEAEKGSYVPYTGATTNVDLGAKNLNTTGTVTAEQITSTDDITMQGNLITLGDGSDTQIKIVFDGSTNDGGITFTPATDLMSSNNKWSYGKQLTSSGNLVQYLGTVAPTSSAQTFKTMAFPGAVSGINGDSDIAEIVRVDGSIQFIQQGPFSYDGTVTEANLYKAALIKSGSGSTATITDFIGFHVHDVEMTITDNAWGYANHNTEVHNVMGWDNSKTYFGTSNDVYNYFDGTNFNWNQTAGGLYQFFNSTSLGAIRVREVYYSTPELSESKSVLDNLKNPDEIIRNGKTEQEFHQSFPNAVQEYISIKDEDNCWNVTLKPTQYCYYNENWDNEGKCSEERLYLTPQEDVKVYEGEECGAKQELVIASGKGYLDNYQLIYQLNEENDAKDIIIADLTARIIALENPEPKL